MNPVFQKFLVIIAILCNNVFLSSGDERGDYHEYIKGQGYSSQTWNLSDSTELKLAMPEIAYVNLISPYGIPYTKTSNFKDQIEYYDPVADVYFKKRIIVNVQGNTSKKFSKRNVSMDFCEDEWIGEESPEIRFGNWVKQDGFHLKAFYTDWLRGVGIVGYQLFDEIEAQMPEEINRIWKRSEMSDQSKHARCYPDGFPCALFLNGEFYGLYVWQLKKNHRNMALKKHQPTHIHLDGALADQTFWNGDIGWNLFDVRNPKGLICMDGKEYDGDNPAELADSPVKESIVALSNRCKELTQMRGTGATVEQIRLYISTYFDIESVINYLVFSTVTSNYDGFTKNWQWLTYDGSKWFVAPYDLDCTFGNFHEGTLVFAPEYSYVDSDHTFQISRRGIVKWFWDYYFDEIKDRYSELRDAGVLDGKHISAMLRQWHNRIGNTLFEWEWEAWPNSMCINPTITNPGWIAEDHWKNYYQTKEWDANTTYKPGDLCRYGYRIWRATETTNQKPCIRMGYEDSLERFEYWISHRIELEDDFLSYTPSAIRSMPEESPFDTIYGPNEHIYSVTGTKLNRLGSGIMIVNGRLVFKK